MCVSACHCLVPLFRFKIALVCITASFNTPAAVSDCTTFNSTEGQLCNKKKCVCVFVWSAGDTRENDAMRNRDRVRHWLSTSESTSLLAWDLRSKVNICPRGKDLLAKWWAWAGFLTPFSASHALIPIPDLAADTEVGCDTSAFKKRKKPGLLMLLFNSCSVHIALLITITVFKSRIE